MVIGHFISYILLVLLKREVYNDILIISFDSLLDFLLKLNVHNGIPVSDFLYKLCIRGEWHERDLEWLKNSLEK